MSIPINSDFTHWAGLYRGVDLIATDGTYISLEDEGSKGIYVDQKLSGNTANLNIRTKISSKNEDNKNLALKTTVLDAEGNIVAENSKDIDLVAKTVNQDFSNNITINNAHLWNGTVDPYLYTVKISLMDGETLVDEGTQKVGLRTFSVKNGKFYLNGKVYELHGVGMHQDREGYGNATSNEMKLEDINTIQEMGANAIRTAHYQHDQYLYDLADERGLIVWTEIPFYLLMADTQTFRETTKQQLTELIRQNYNHPSIICWGIQNEVNTNPQIASYGKEFNVSTETLSSFIRELAALAKTEDSSRFVVQAHIDGTEKLNESLTWTKNSDIDYTGFNLYYGFKSAVKKADDTGTETIKKQFSNKIDKDVSALGQDSIVISEYGAGANINQHATIDENFSWSGDDSNEPQHPEEYQSYVLEAAYDQISKKSNVWCAFVWNMFDFSSYRNPAGQTRLNDKGLVTYDHKTRKDAFYFYKANWNKTDKFTYITSRRYTERTTKDSTIKVYSNCDKVKLYVNGKDCGYGNLQQSGVFVWDNFNYQKNNVIKAVGEYDGKTTEDTIYVNCSDAEDNDYNISYNAHVQDIGWQDPVSDGETAGTIGESKKVEAISLHLNESIDGGIKYQSSVQDIGWQSWVKNGKVSGTTGQNKRLEAIRIKLTGKASEVYDIYYRAHVQDYGWLDLAKNGQIAGTVGMSKRLEGYEVKLIKKGDEAPGETDNPSVSNSITYSSYVKGAGWQIQSADGMTSGNVLSNTEIEALKINLGENLDGNVSYETYVKDSGWQNWKKNGKVSGTIGKKLNIQALKIKISGKIADKYNVYYRTYVDGYGWLDWAKNGQVSGTTGMGKSIQAVQISLVDKKENAPGKTNERYKKALVKYRTHVQDYGWQNYKYNDEISGTEGESKRLEGINISLVDSEYTGNIKYRVHVQDYGWMSWVSNGKLAGTTGESKRLEAIQIKLDGDMNKKYDVYYRVHAQNFGWLDWAKNGQKAGTSGYSYRLEAIQISIVKKGAKAPGKTMNYYYSK